jgi:hypothetical protein
VQLQLQRERRHPKRPWWLGELLDEIEREGGCEISLDFEIRQECRECICTHKQGDTPVARSRIALYRSGKSGYFNCFSCTLRDPTQRICAYLRTIGGYRRKGSSRRHKRSEEDSLYHGDSLRCLFRKRLKRT